MTNLYDISLGLTTVFLLTALGWSVLLRRRIREQTEQIRGQMEREASLELKYRDLFENANDMVFSQDSSGHLASLNKAGERILACSRERARQLNLKSFVAPHQAESFGQWLGDCLAGKASQSYELEMVASDGRASIVELSTRLLKKDGLVQGLEGIGRDITERRRAEEALRQSEERFSSAFRLSPVAIAISTLAEGRHLDVNESFLRMFGFQREEVINRTAAELGLWADPEDQARVEELLRSSRSVSGVECKFRAKSTGVRSTLIFVERIDLRDTACALTIIHDMTDRIKLEAQLRNAMKMEAVGRLAAGVAHDFNNLLTVIQGNAEVSLAGRCLDGPSAKSFERISEAAQKAANLTRQLLTFSRKQNIQPKPLDLNEVILGAAKMFKHLLRDDILLNFKFASNLPIIKADLTMIEQVVMNLVVNARDAMPKGGEIRIGTDFVDVDKAHIDAHPDATVGHFVRLSVADTGCGMDAATQSRIFEPFFTTKDVGKGTGLGLATVYGIVKQHNGWIELTSEVGKGTTFEIYMPYEASAKPIASTSNVPQDDEAHKPTILAVEDESSVAEFVCSLLREGGYRVLEAANGLEAMQVWSDHQGRIDLLLTDIKMPRGMNGLELADNLRALKPSLKVIYTSGNSPELDDGSWSLPEDSTFLPKPYSPPKLLQVVRSSMN